ncbi:hypothetical protein [Kitasatospora paranensis]|uniref:hypothetical protein n=1 Tax=Kitasatospora paranensis TaxID=258053 RepID=UPI0031EB54AB
MPNAADSTSSTTIAVTGQTSSAPWAPSSSGAEKRPPSPTCLAWATRSEAGPSRIPSCQPISEPATPPTARPTATAMPPPRRRVSRKAASAVTTPAPRASSANTESAPARCSPSGSV